jgi:riboflavin kinase/FMN adenylyltransferase
MRVFRGLHHSDLADHCALTVGNFDGVHRGHQAMLALLVSEAAHRGLTSTVMTFEPNPRDYFAALAGKPDAAPARIATLRDKLGELERCGIEQAVVLRFDAAFAAQSPHTFIDNVLVAGLGTRYVLVGDDFRFGARRAGDYTMLDAAGMAQGFDVARMMSYEVHGARVSSSAVRAALAGGRMKEAESLLGRPYSISGRVVYGDKLGRQIGFPTANVQLRHNRPPLSGIFAVSTLDGRGHRRDGAASLGLRPTVDNSGRAKLEVHLFDFAGDLYGQHLRIDFLHKIRDEEKFPSLDALKARIAQDCDIAREFLAAKERA